MPRALLRLAGVLLLAAAALGVPPPAVSGSAEPTRGPGLTVFAAASLADAMTEIGRTFESASHVHVSFNFGASSDLGRQIRAGAPADVFFSADEAQMDLVEHAGFVRPADRVNLLSNTLVVIVPAAAGTPPRTLRSAAEIASFTRLALADPEAVPAGVYARAYLQSMGLWDKLSGRIVPTLNVRGALAAVETENVPAGIVYRTDAAVSRRVSVAFEVPRDAGPKIVYVVAPVREAAGSAAPFVAALAAPDATRVFEKYGFIVLPRHP
jgi:molybdate transport system substrate-binding protein